MTEDEETDMLISMETWNGRNSFTKYESNTGDELMEILETGNIRTVFQPIVSLRDGSILGYEALSRGPSQSALESPAILFDVARIYGKLWELELLCRIKALENMSEACPDIKLFLNVDPQIINDEKFKKGFTKEFLKQFDIDPQNIIFEITENSAVNDLKSFKKAIENYKEQGYKIAIDDTGAGYSGLKLITDLHPQYIKLDMNLIRDIDKDGLKHALIKTLYEFCQVTDIKVIAEGIETENELNTLIDIGITYGQGYLLQRPIPELKPLDPSILQLIRSRNQRKTGFYHNRPTTIPIGDICRKSLTVGPTASGSQVLELFNANPYVSGLPVVENGKLLGLVTKDRFYSKLGTQYGFALFLNRPITLLMDSHPLVVEYNMTIDVVSRLAMTRSDEFLYDYIIVTCGSEYSGIITVKDLLVKTTELEVNYAKHLNPLSGLPGNILIEEKLRDTLKSPGRFTVLYMDIDNFKVYNDIYGFENGDRILQFVSRTITECVAANAQCGSFIGHIGGDDFVVAVDSYEVEQLCEAIISAFDRGICEFYSREHLDTRVITARNRHGQEEKFGLLTLSIAGIRNKTCSFSNVYELSECAVKLKKKCKQVWSSCYLLE